MGTKVQCESYLPGYFSMRIPTEDSSSNWSPYFQDKTLNEHLYSSFMLRPVSEYSGYDKEILKHTVLEHEAIFRKQVYELHRLYRTQKDLMEDLKRKEFHEFPVQSGISQPYLFSSAVASETTEEIWRLPLFNKDVVASNDGIKPSLEILEGKYMLVSQIPRKNECSLNNGEFSNSKPECRPRQLLDLQLPADVFIGDDNFGRIQKDDIFKPFCRVRDNQSITCAIEHEDDVKLTLGTRKGCGRGSWNSNPIRQNSPSMQGFDHMNGFKKGSSCEGQSGSDSNHFLYGDQSPMRSNRSFMLKDFFMDKHRDDGACSKFFNADKGKAQLGWSSFNCGDGISENGANSFNLGLSSEKCLVLSEPSELKRKRAQNSPSHDHSQMQTWFEGKPTVGTEPYQNGLPFADPNRSTPTTSLVPGPFSVISCSEYSSCASPITSSRREPPKIITHIPIAVQALPCFPASEMTKFRSKNPKGSIQNPTVQNGSQQDLWMDCNSMKRFKNDCDSSVSENPEDCASHKCPESEKDVHFSMLLHNGTSEDENIEALSKGGTESSIQSPEYPASESTAKILGFPICTASAKDAKTKVKNEVCEVGKDMEKGISIDLNTLDISTENEDTDSEVPLPPHDALDSLAAENLVIMLLDSTQQSPPAACDSLRWFADVVSSKEANADYNDNDEVDLFEALTLKLEEMKPDAYLPPWEVHEKKTDENYMGTKPWKGRARKRRQKKDFQKDVLPGLVTLSKHQMTEDLHAFDCLMRAMGETWESKFTRTTSRKRSRSSPPTRAAAHSKVEIDQGSILGWGRTTRRGRRPRVRRVMLMPL